MSKKSNFWSHDGKPLLARVDNPRSAVDKPAA
jgi:hypothetical protein